MRNISCGDRLLPHISGRLVRRGALTISFIVPTLFRPSAVVAARDLGFSASECGAVISKTSSAEPPVKDMIGSSDDVPHGTVAPDGRQINWALQPRVWRGNKPRPGWQIMASTAMIYATRKKPVSHGVRVQVRQLELFVKPSVRKAWCLLDSVESPAGGLYIENFAGDQSIPLQPHPERSGGYSISMVPGRNFHFWGRKKPIPTGGIMAIYVQFEARIINEDANKRKNIADAAYVGSASADYWRSATTLSGQPGVLNEDAGIGRFKRLTSDWQLFTMNTNGGPSLAPSIAD